MNKKIYISGGITGVRNYKKHFAKAEKMLIKKGYEVVNPVTIREKMEISDKLSGKKHSGIIFKETAKALLDGCTHVYLLREYHRDNYSMVECHIAVACGLHIIYAGEA